MNKVDSSQLDKFKEAASELETDNDEARFDERLGKIVKHKPLEKTLVVTFYLSTRKGSMPLFHTRLELDELPAVHSALSIPGDTAEKPMNIEILANSENNPSFGELLRDSGAWVVCQEK